MIGKDAVQLRHFFQQLTYRDRYILLLFYADGLTPAEIGLVLERSAQRVESRLDILKLEARSVLGGGESLAGSAGAFPGAIVTA